MAKRTDPYIVIRADAPLDSRWTADLWFAWSRLLGQCRLKRACTAETWPAAVLRLRTIEVASILAVHPNKVRWMLDRLVIPASMTARCERDHGGDLWVISVAKYAEHQKLGRPTYDLSSAEVRTPPNVPTSQRPNEEEEQMPSASGVEAPPRGKSRWVNLLRNVPGFDPAEADERAAWVETFEGEIESRAASELPADATKKQVNERARSILLARWRTYVTKGPRIFAGIAHRLERDRIKAEWAAQHGEAHDRELAEVGSL